MDDKTYLSPNNFSQIYVTEISVPIPISGGGERGAFT
jgi:hypothetical protein